MPQKTGSSVPAAASAMSRLADRALACEQTAQTVRASLAGRTPDLSIVFVSGDHAAHPQDIARELRQRLGTKTTITVPAQSIIGGAFEHERATGISVLALSLPGVEVRPFRFRDLPAGPIGSDDVRSAARELLGPPQTHRATLFFADPFGVPGPSAVSLLGEPGDRAVPVLGGMASAFRTPGAHTLVLNGTPVEGGGVGVALHGPITVDSLVSQGCTPVGEPLVVTAGERNVIAQLGGRPAGVAIRELVQNLSDHHRERARGGLLLGTVINEYKKPLGRGDFLIRAVVGLDRESGAIAVSDIVRPGQTVQFHVRDAQTAREDLEMLLSAEAFAEPPIGCALFTCNGRGELFFGEPHVDAHTMSEGLSHDGSPVPMAGFFAAGEFGPIGGRSFLHSHTASAAIFRRFVGAAPARGPQR